MNKPSALFCLLTSLMAVSFLSCRKDGLNSATAKKIQYKWEKISTSAMTDYLDGRATNWTVKTYQPGSYLEYDKDGYYYDIYGSNSTRYEYKVDGDKILSLRAAQTRATTPQYTDTAIVRQADDHLLILFRRRYFIAPPYSYIDEYLDSLKR